MTVSEEHYADAVRPLHGRVVRQECAADNVWPMPDVPTRSGARMPTRPVHPEAYEDSGPACYLYRLRRGTEEHLGVVGEVRPRAFLSGQVRGHEAVQPERLRALIEHYATGAVRTELVTLLHRPTERTRAAMAATSAEEPVLRFAGADGWEQTVWRLPHGRTEGLLEELGHRVHYVADGHHRVAANLELWRAAGEPDDSGVLCVLYPFDGLRLSAFHRRLPGPVVPDELFARLAQSYDVRRVDGPGDVTGALGIYVAGSWFDAARRGARAPGAAGLDAAILDELVLTPMTSGDEGRPALEIADASDEDRLARACDLDGGVLFAMRPPALQELIEVADRGEVMPPKTTFFAPKPYAGVFLR